MANQEENGDNSYPLNNTKDKKTNVDYKLSVVERISIIVQNITVEPLLVCFIFPSMIMYLATQNLNLEKACRVNLNYTEDVCNRIIANRDVNNLQEEIQRVQIAVSRMQLWKAPLQLVLPAIMIIFVGSWSDRSGRRKLFMMTPPIGDFISCAGLLLCVYYFTEWPLEVAALIEAIPSAICGGHAIIFMAVHSYLSDITTLENRTFRLGIASIISAIGSPVGSALSGVIIRYTGYYGVFSIIGSLYIFAFFYTLIRIEDKNVKKRENVPCFLVDFFNPKFVADTFKVLLKPRKGYNRMKLVTLVFMCLLMNGTNYGEYGVKYLFVRYRFNFTEVDYSIYGTYASIIHLFGTFFAVTVLIRRFKVNDYYLGIIGGCSKIASSFVFAFAPSVKLFYMGPVVDCISGISGTALKSIASKIVDPSEIGRIYSLMGIVDALSPAVYFPIYNLIYQNTLHTFPSAYYFLGTFSFSVVVTFHIIMLLSQRGKQESKTVSNKPYEEISQVDENNKTSDEKTY